MKRSAKFGLVAVALALLTVGCGTSSGTAGGGPVTGVAGPTTAATTVPATKTKAPTNVRPQDKGFTVIGVQLKAASLGGSQVFGGTAEVKNTGTTDHTASMRFTFSENGMVVGVGDATTQVAAGQTVTVDLASVDKWDGGPVTYNFQVTSLY